MIYKKDIAFFNKGELEYKELELVSGTFYEARAELHDAMSKLKYDIYKAASPSVEWLIKLIMKVLRLW